jgi:3-hydroxymyristoyl/3-hydroxydecanoyl-(acyl carrier protein) dehydratase
MVPGGILIEAMGQALSLLVFKYTEDKKKGRHLLYLTGVRNAKFRKIIRPNDQLRICAEITKCRDLTFWEGKCTIIAGAGMACEALISSMLVKVK